MHNALLLFSLLLPLPAAQRATCLDVASCREAALAAAAQHDFEAFHDLAWRAAQKGRPNDPELMYLIARAQSLSGRPGDALVMLRRLAQMGIDTDAGENEDFRRVRALPGWPDVEALIVAAREPEFRRVPTAATNPQPPGQRMAASPVEHSPARPAPFASPPAVATRGIEEAVQLPEASLDPVGLAYDGASRRFVLGDRRANRLIVADDVFKHVNDLIGARSAGFGSLTAVEIDGRRGDLWVTSTAANGGASVHKLQLVSGRVLSSIDVPEELRPATFSDMFITHAGDVVLLDSSGSRLLRVTPSSHGFERPVPLGLTSPMSIAPTAGAAYVAHDAGLSIVDLASGRATDVRASSGVSLAGLRRIRWYRGALIAVQAGAAGEPPKLVRIRLARRGNAASSVELLDDRLDADATALTISRDAVYYFALGENGAIIRRLPLR